MMMKKIIIEIEGKKAISTDKPVTIKDTRGFPIVKIEPDKIKVKEEIEIIKI